MAGKKYKFIDHTADVEFVAYGKTAQETFANSLLALFDTLADIKRVKAAKGKAFTIKIKDHAANLDDLLWDTLQDALSMTDAEGLYAYEVRKIAISVGTNDFEINAEITAKPKKAEFSKLDVKGVSKFDLKVKKGKRAMEASVVLDV